MAWPELPKRALYALKSLCFLATAEGPVCAREVARCTGIPPAETAKILYLLAWGGFVSSRRGSKGGFWLRRTPRRIRIGDVVEFLSSPSDRSDERSNDPVLRIWRQTAASSNEAFNRVSLEELAMQLNYSAARREQK
ncbi:MAG TPA: Rrf2 family transcriptional regulator [Terriglobia bacterium]|nr:Rrf2 family transcriptional regulator [Terriglobia bacterium]